MMILPQSVSSNKPTVRDIPDGADEKNRYRDVLPSMLPQCQSPKHYLFSFSIVQTLTAVFYCQ